MNVHSDIARHVRKHAVIYLAAGGFGTGFGVGYFAAHRKAQKAAMLFWAEKAEAEIEDARRAMSLLRKEPPFDDPRTALKEYGVRLDGLQYRLENGDEAADAMDAAIEAEDKAIEAAKAEAQSMVDEDSDDEVEGDAVVINIFAEHGDDVEVYEVIPDEENPFVITVGDYMEGQEDFDKLTITYYDGDDTLCDEREVIIADVERTVGSENLHKFGVGSGDKTIVYVRNIRLTSDFEIILHEGKYSEHVLGYVDEKPMSRRKKPKRDEQAD